MAKKISVSVSGTVEQVIILSPPEVEAKIQSDITAALVPVNNSIEDNASRIDALESLGRFLSGWDSTTGLPTTNPPTGGTAQDPYMYKTGDWYEVVNVGATNFKPVGDSYNGSASTTAETDTVKVGYIYRYDGTAWQLVAITTPTVPLATASTPGIVKGNADHTVNASGELTHGAGTITKAMLQTAVQTSLGKADSALQSVPDATTSVKGIATLGATGGAATYARCETAVTNAANALSIANGKYTKPATGIPFSDLAADVQDLFGVVGGANYTLLSSDWVSGGK